MEKNEILIRYESLGNMDYKVCITNYLVCKYVQATTGLSEGLAKKKTLEMKDEEKGWAEVIGYDERFYDWCKRRFYNKASSQKSKNRVYVLYWLNDNGELQSLNCSTKNQAFQAFTRVSQKGRPSALYPKTVVGDVFTNPIRVKRAENLLDIVQKQVLDPQFEENKSEATRCRKARGLSDCKECARYTYCLLRDE